MRQKLPNRRPCVTETIEVCDHPGAVPQRYHLSIGFDPETGVPRELFLSGPKTGTQLAALAHDGSILASIALQNGMSARRLVQSLSMIEVGASHAPASPIGTALAVVAEYEPSQEGGDG